MLKKINEILKNNSEIIDFFAKIVLAIVSISIAINANKIAKSQQKIDELNVLPDIQIEHNDLDEIQVVNNGAPIYDVQIQYESIVSLMTRKEIPLENGTTSELKLVHIMVEDYYDTERKSGNSTGVLLEIINFNLKQNFNEFKNDLQEIYTEKGLTFMAKIDTYINLSYIDYLGRECEECFALSGINTKRISKKEMSTILAKEFKNQAKIQLNSSSYEYVIELLENAMPI